jgi:hypothetical protein
MVLDTVPDNLVPVISAHASLGFYLEFNGYKPFGLKYTSEILTKWVNTSFRKVVCRVNQKEFDKLKTLEYTNITTSSELEGAEVTVTLLSSLYEELPNVVKFAKLWKF